MRILARLFMANSATVCRGPTGTLVKRFTYRHYREPAAAEQPAASASAAGLQRGLTTFLHPTYARFDETDRSNLA